MAELRTGAGPAPARGLSRQERLRKRRDFLLVQGQGRKLQTPSFLVFLLARGAPDLSGARLGITVSKKVGPSVERNLIKRRVREAFRLHKMLFPVGHDVVFVAKRAAKGQTHQGLCGEIEALCRRHFPSLVASAGNPP